MKPNAIMLMLGGILLMSVAFLGDAETPDKPDVPVMPGVDDGNRVLIVYESEDKPTYPIGQAMVLDSATFREYLAGKCDPDGWRFEDQNVDTAHMDEIWQRWLKRDRESLPWIMISNGESKAEGPLPLTIELTQALIDGVIK
jgi:hypothetical protein